MVSGASPVSTIPPAFEPPARYFSINRVLAEHDRQLANAASPRRTSFEGNTDILMSRSDCLLFAPRKAYCGRSGAASKQQSTKTPGRLHNAETIPSTALHRLLCAFSP
jgi:hypothetical protein